MRAERTTVTEYLLDLFKNANISGGVAIVTELCEEESPTDFPTFKGQVGAALEKLVSMGHQLKWTQIDGNLLVQNSTEVVALLKVHVRHFRFSRKEPLTKASSDLFGTPEVMGQARALNLTEYGPELGFAQLLQSATPEDVIELENTTVLDALNAIAAHHAIWVYRQSTCGRGQMSLSWPVR